MESSDVRTYHADLAQHPLFRGLKQEERAALKRYYRMIRIPPGAEFLYPGEEADSLYILLSGTVRSGKRVFYKGDFWGLDKLIQPGITDEAFRSGDECVLVRLQSENFRKMLKDHPGLARHFRPRKDEEDHLVGGIPETSWKSVKKFASRQEKRGTLIHYKSRTSKKAFSFSLLLPFAIALAGILLSGRHRLFGLLVPLGILILGAELFLRNLTLYKVSDRAVIKKYFNWRTLRQDQEIIPIDQVQSVTVSTRGLLSKLMRIGDLQVQTAGKGILFSRIDAPVKLQSQLMALKKRAAIEEKGRERDALREMIGSRFTPETADQLLYAGDRSAMELDRKEGQRTFRKSPALLVFQLLLPSILIAAVFLRLPHPWMILMYGVSGTGLLRALWVSLDWWNDRYMIHLPYLWDIERKPFGKEDVRKQTELSLVLNVTASQKGLPALLFNYGDVVIETAGRGEPLIFYSVRKPFEVQKDLLTYRDYNLRKGEQKKRERAREDLMEFTEILDQARRRETALANGATRRINGV